MSAVTEALERELRGLGSRLRDSPSHWFAAAAPPFATRGDVAFHVVQLLAHSAFAREFPGRPLPPLTRLPALALAEQFDVVSRELLAVVAEDDAFAAPLLAELLLHRWHLDGSAPGPSATRAVQAVIGPGDLESWQRMCAAVPTPR